MQIVDESIVINRSPQDVWDFLRMAENQLLWQSSLIEFDADSDEPKVGERSRGVTKTAGRKFAWTTEVTQVDPGKTVAFRSVESPFPLEFRQSFEDVDGGCRFRIHGETPGTGGFFGRIGDSVAAKMYARGVRSDLENLKALLEA